MPTRDGDAGAKRRVAASGSGLRDASPEQRRHTSQDVPARSTFVRACWHGRPRIDSETLWRYPAFSQLCRRPAARRAQ